MGRRRSILTRAQELTGNEIAEALDRHGSVRLAAEELGVTERSLRRAIQRTSGQPHGEPETLADDPVEVPVIRRDYSCLEKLCVYPLGDVHKGSPRHHAAKWREWLTYLRHTDGVSFLGTGDFLNCAIVGSKSDVYEEEMTVGDAKRELRRELQPLADKIDVLMPGNHEARIHRTTGDCPILDVADALDVPYARSSALVIYTVGDQEYTCYLRHGSGMGQSLAQLHKAGAVIDADIYVTGHLHRAAHTVDDRFYFDGDRVRRRRVDFVASGSFLSAEAYALERGYVPTRLGVPRIFLDGVTRDVHVSI